MDTLFVRRTLTSDLNREFLLQRPWSEDLNRRTFLLSPPNVAEAGYYYPEYYPRAADKFQDLTELYFAYRESDPEAIERAYELMRPLVEAWMRPQGQARENAVIVPMIGKAPNQALAERIGFPVVFPWLPRPEDYGRGVEGARAFMKMKMLQAALRLDPRHLAALRGKSVLLLDDNATDDTTYMQARRLLFDAGATQVGLVTLTRTIRSPLELR